MTMTFRFFTAAAAFCLSTGTAFSVFAEEQTIAADKIIEKVVEKTLEAQAERINFKIDVQVEPVVAEAKVEKTEAPKEAKVETPVVDGQELFFIMEQEPGKMSGVPFSASNEDRKALPQSVYNWVLNNLGASKNCSKWVANFCSEDFNLVSYEPLKDTKQFVILQHQFSLRQERMVYYVLSADGELLQMQLSRDEKVTIKPNSSLIN